MASLHTIQYGDRGNEVFRYGKLLSLLLCCLLQFLPVAAQRKKVGLVLGGGGAKGVAHVGVLKVLEEEGIPVDYIIGTSMGAIIGGLYAIGYDSHTLDSLIRSQDWTFLLSDNVSNDDMIHNERENQERYLISLPFDRRTNLRGPMGLVRGQNVYNLFTDLIVGHHGEVDFSAFPIPFACVAVDMFSRREVVMQHGELATAMRASMAIPGFFTPVELDSLLLVDGGILNNFPTDIMRSWGVDVVIGVDVQAELMDAGKLSSVTNVLPQLINLLCMNKYEENLKYADILIRPEVSEYSAASFSTAAIDTMLLRGEAAAAGMRERFRRLKRELGIDGEEEKRGTTPSGADAEREYFIRKIEIEGVGRQEKEWVLRKTDLREDSRVTLREINQAINLIYATHLFSTAHYRLTGGPEYDLTFLLTPHPQNLLNVGFRFDTEEMAALLLNVTLSNRLIKGTQTAVTARLSKNPYVRIDISLENLINRYFSLSGEFRFNNINLYEKGEKTNNATYRYYMGEVSGSILETRKFFLKAGVRYEFFDYNSFLFTSEEFMTDVYPEGLISYYMTARYNSFDNSYYPERGGDFKLDYRWYTDNLVTYDGRTPFSALMLHCSSVFSLTNRLKLLPVFTGRVLIGRSPSYNTYNVMGGIYPGRYREQQLPFWGINRIEFFDRSLAIGRLQLRQRIGGRRYLSLVGNVALRGAAVDDLFSATPIWGGGVCYSRNLRIGPVDFVASYSNRTKQPELYFNLGLFF